MSGRSSALHSSPKNWNLGGSASNFMGNIGARLEIVTPYTDVPPNVYQKTSVTSKSLLSNAYITNSTVAEPLPFAESLAVKWVTPKSN